MGAGRLPSDGHGTVNSRLSSTNMIRRGPRFVARTVSHAQAALVRVAAACHQVAVSSMFGVPSVLLCPTENSVVSPAVFALFILLSRFAEHDKPASLNSSPRRVPGNRTRDTPAARGDGICGWS